MVNGNRPPARIENDRSPDGKLKSHLEWPKMRAGSHFEVARLSNNYVIVNKGL